jgi:Ca2+/Na+ antiporter
MIRLALVIVVFGIALILMGIKALLPSGISLSAEKKLSRRTSTIIGSITILFGIGVAILGLFIPLWFVIG